MTFASNMYPQIDISLLGTTTSKKPCSSNIRPKPTRKGTTRPIKKSHTIKSRVNSKLEKVKKCVSFSNFASVVAIPSYPGEIKDLWLQTFEYVEIEKRRRDTLCAVLEAKENWGHFNPEEHCLRGLEHQLSPHVCLQRKDTNMQYRKLLIEEQEYQTNFGLKDPEALRRLSEVFSKHCTTQARIRAMID